jgi:hypothetical protein
MVITIRGDAPGSTSIRSAGAGTCVPAPASYSVSVLPIICRYRELVIARLELVALAVIPDKSGSLKVKASNKGSTIRESADASMSH